jgi:hypothetical protein
MSTSEGEKKLDPTLDPTLLSVENRRRLGEFAEYFPLIATDLESLILEVARNAERRGMERMWEAVAQWYEANVESSEDADVEEGAVFRGLLRHMRLHHNQMPETIDRHTYRDLLNIGYRIIPDNLPEMPHWVSLLPQIREKYSTPDQTIP